MNYQQEDFIVWALARLTTRRMYENNYILFDQTDKKQRQKVAELTTCITIMEEVYYGLQRNLEYIRRCQSLEQVYSRLCQYENDGDNLYLANAIHENWKMLWKWLYYWEE